MRENYNIYGSLNGIMQVNELYALDYVAAMILLKREEEPLYLAPSDVEGVCLDLDLAGQLERSLYPG
jgi:hypothetical protein